MLLVVNVPRDAVGVVTGRTKEPTVSTLRRLASIPAPAALRGWHLEALALTALVGGLIGMATGAY
jgi:hypothetical protein